ncbi:dienelactone hydrolase family protein [Herbaspirillum lusitanum]|uniref:Dienelactone hydrolase family protein n=1 Tax=Herbaspirillum lusitanum TaxID=213312 RepID=A0ABW9AGN1_9BURK
MMSAGQIHKMAMRDGAHIEVYRVPAKGERRGGIVLIQEIFGLTAHIREQCDSFAEEGYEVWAPAIFDREAPGLQLSYSPEDIARAIDLVKQHSMDQAVSDAQICIEALAKIGHVFMLGYCYGGSVSWACACRLPQLSGASCYYGSRIPDLAHETPQCPVALHFGEFDQEIPLDRVQAVRALRPEAEIWTYAAAHGFNSDRRSDFDASSAQLARQRTLDLYKRATMV